MQELIKTLRKSASCQPNNADLFLQAANEIERLRESCEKWEQATFEMSEMTKQYEFDERKIKAEAVREAGNIFKSMPRTIAKIHGDKILEIANKLERGEL